MHRRMGIGLLLGLLVYAGLVLWGDLGAIGEALGDLNPWLVPAAMGLSFANYLVRFIRWQRYLSLLSIRLERGTSFLIHLSGLALTVTPGKMGEVLKSWLIKRVEGSPISHTASIVVAERFTDLLGFLLLVAIGGLATAPENAWIFWATLGLCALLLVGVGSVRLGELGCSLLTKLPLVSGLAPRVRTALSSTRVLLAPRELLLPTLLATLGWGLECTGFWLIADSLVEADLPFLFAVYTFALSAVAGAVLILFPGGLGVTEATLTGLLSARYRALGVVPGAAAAKAVTATVVIRLCTLWFAMGIGMLALSIFSRKHPDEGTRPA